jgi:hypothetical protein
MNAEDADLCLLNMNSDSEKKRLQKLVEESDIELTKHLFYGDSSIDCVLEEKNNATAETVIDKPVKKPFIKKAKKANNVEKIVESSGVVKAGRKKMTLARINEVFGGGSSELDPYELE